ncbi:MAG TPA: hypothetical protein PLD20_35300 [Blastocatellia bacterium]|nr:hypothetical protein [Blastocatellia bacterium]HMV81554.1 hypothetical protein [Blastocatellia bacterium]HMX25772.1 hypothetical protein [Blastocatellia bacterium]HMZ23244.1 hypothetical protein [Blastocatellia bacterium]HNG28515.1 hypothetical protein [Blastocatellia bacterium]
MKEALPLATIQNSVIDFLRGRDDVVLFGAQAVNVYVNEPRATQDVDLMSTRTAELTEDLANHLSKRFHVYFAWKKSKVGDDYKLFQLRENETRHLVDVRSAVELPPAQRIEGVLVALPVALIAGKVISQHRRHGKPKAWTDRRDLALLLLTFPELKCDPGAVTDCLNTTQPDQQALSVWRELVRQTSSRKLRTTNSNHPQPR